MGDEKDNTSDKDLKDGNKPTPTGSQPIALKRSVLNVDGIRIAEEDDEYQEERSTSVAASPIKENISNIALFSTSPASTPKSRPLELPNQKRPVGHFSMDIGGSLIKLVYFESFEKGGGRLHFAKFETQHIDECLKFIKDNNLHLERGGKPKEVTVTGGGAYKYSELIESSLGIMLHKADEMQACISGLNFLLAQVPQEAYTYSTEANDPDPKKFVPAGDRFPYLLVNIGSGVSIIRVDGPHKYQRISGTSLGGGTFYGLCSLMTGLTDFDEMMALSVLGDSTKVDLAVGDIYGADYSSIGLKADIIASSFGKLVNKQNKTLLYDKPDIILSLLKMVCNNIGQVAYLNAVHNNLTRIYFGGFFLRSNPAALHKLSFAVNFWSKGTIQAMFLLHEGYLGALGAFLQHYKDYNWEEQEAALLQQQQLNNNNNNVYGMYEKSKQWLQKMLSLDIHPKQTPNS